jgi:hypothetical protein
MAQTQFDSDFQSNRKQIKANFKNFIESNNQESLDALLADEFNSNLLKNERFFDPFTIAIRSNRINLIEYLINKGFRLNGGFNESRNNNSVHVTTREAQPNDSLTSLNKRKFDEINEEDYDCTVSSEDKNENLLKRELNP